MTEGVRIVITALSVGLPLAWLIHRTILVWRWSRALREYCGQEPLLECQRIRGWFDQASGTVSGRAVSVRIFSRFRSRLKVEVTTHVGNKLLIKARGARRLFFEKAAGPPSPIDDPGFDHAIDLRGAWPELQQALRQQSDLRDLVTRAVRAGAYVCFDQLVLLGRGTPCSSAAIRAAIEPLVQLAWALDKTLSQEEEEPTAGHVLFR